MYGFSLAVKGTLDEAIASATCQQDLGDTPDSMINYIELRDE